MKTSMTCFINNWKRSAVYTMMESKMDSDFSFKTCTNMDSYSLKSGKFCKVSRISGKMTIILLIDMTTSRKIQVNINTSTIIAAIQYAILQYLCKKFMIGYVENDKKIASDTGNTNQSMTK